MSQTSKKSKDFVVGHCYCYSYWYCYCYLPNKGRQRKNERTNPSQEFQVLGTRDHLGPSWGHLGTILSYRHLGPSWDHLGTFLNHLGPSWGHVGTILGHLGPWLDHLGTILDHLGPSWNHLGISRVILGQLGQTGPKNLQKRVPRIKPTTAPFSAQN